MAKKKTADVGEGARAVNKSQEIRGYKADHPEAGPKEIVEALAKIGVVVSSAQVSTTLSNAKKKGDKPIGKRGRKATSKAAQGTTITVEVVSGTSINQLADSFVGKCKEEGFDPLKTLALLIEAKGM